MSWLAVSEEEARFRTQRGFRFSVIALWTLAVVVAVAAAHRWGARDFDGFVLCWFGTAVLALTLALISLAMLQMQWPAPRLFFALSSMLSVAIVVGTVTLTVKVPRGAAERFDGSLIKRSVTP